MKIAYLINQYPKVSHTFIRREILALESLDPTLEIARFSIRPSQEEFKDVADQQEARRTVSVLVQGMLPLIFACLATAISRPIRFLRAIALAVRLGWKGERGLMRHLIYLIEAVWLHRKLAHEKIVHVHAHFGTNSTTVAMLVHVLGNIPYSFTVHGPEEFDKVTILGLDKKIWESSFVVAISDFGRSQLMRWCPSSQWRKLQVVRCGVDAAYIDAVPPPIEDSKVLVCVGRLCEQKGQLLLIEAVGKLVQTGIEVQLRLVGDGPMRAECEEAIDRLKLTNNVKITGWASGEQVRNEILGARIFVLPSFAEGLPVVLMEALALQRPVISTYVAGIPELVRPGENGWLVPAGDVQALAEAMRAALEMPFERLNEMGKCGRKCVLEQHDIRKEVAKLVGLFKDGKLSPFAPQKCVNEAHFRG